VDVRRRSNAPCAIWGWRALPRRCLPPCGFCSNWPELPRRCSVFRPVGSGCISLAFSRRAITGWTRCKSCALQHLSVTSHLAKEGIDHVPPERRPSTAPSMRLWTTSTMPELLPSMPLIAHHEEALVLAELKGILRDQNDSRSSFADFRVGWRVSNLMRLIEAKAHTGGVSA
jgi:hypothetical protein